MLAEWWFGPMLEDHITYDGIPYLPELSHRGLRVHLARDRVYFTWMRLVCLYSPTLPTLALYLRDVHHFTRGNSCRSGCVVEIVTLSTAEAEYVAATHAAKEAI